MFAQPPDRSRLDLLGDDAEDDVLVASPHHRPQRVVPLYGGAHVAGRGDSLAVDADDDVALLQAGSVTKQEEWNLTSMTVGKVGGNSLETAIHTH